MPWNLRFQSKSTEGRKPRNRRCRRSFQESPRRSHENSPKELEKEKKMLIVVKLFKKNRFVRLGKHW